MNRQQNAPECDHNGCRRRTYSGSCWQHKRKDSSKGSSLPESKIIGAPTLSHSGEVTFGDERSPKISSVEVDRISEKLRVYGRPSALGDQEARRLLDEIGKQTQESCQDGKPWTYDHLDEWLSSKANEVGESGASGKEAKSVVMGIREQVMKEDPRHKEAVSYFKDNFPDPAFGRSDFPTDERYQDYLDSYSSVRYDTRHYYSGYLATSNPIKTDQEVSGNLDGNTRPYGWNHSELGDKMFDRERATPAEIQGWDEASLNAQKTSEKAIKHAYKYG